MPQNYYKQQQRPGDTQEARELVSRPSRSTPQQTSTAKRLAEREQLENARLCIAESTWSVYNAFPDPTSHTLTVLSIDADASVLPPGEKATALTQSEWPLSV
ncbi:hypothetical protein DM02DRAFT_662619 [Periconia macrospinosa]|uniref:Uncharacterized protein n=1 Tax=Periconia macrospinosa TaxID=97972 RepID=A0A2V1D424_9PLEO|nr:hypothetical protein DM02DRAFT_662619 [Periconia macrospinosa]